MSLAPAHPLSTPSPILTYILRASFIPIYLTRKEDTSNFSCSFPAIFLASPFPLFLILLFFLPISSHFSCSCSPFSCPSLPNFPCSSPPTFPVPTNFPCPSPPSFHARPSHLSCSSPSTFPGPPLLHFLLFPPTYLFLPLIIFPAPPLLNFLLLPSYCSLLPNFHAPLLKLFLFLTSYFFLHLLLLLLFPSQFSCSFPPTFPAPAPASPPSIFSGPPLLFFLLIPFCLLCSCFYSFPFTITIPKLFSPHHLPDPRPFSRTE